MKKTIFFTILIFLSGIGFCQTTISDSISFKIARKIKDSLQLTSAQEAQLINANQYLANRKIALRGRFTSMDSLRNETQKIEGMRDSLYNNILADKFILYRQKKSMLVNNN
jgi:hypothetical protein